MTTRNSPHNQTTVPVLDCQGQPLAPARPSRVRRWLESGRATKVWVKGIFAVQLHDVDAANATVGEFALNLDPGHTSGIAITRETNDGKHRYIVGAYEHQHRNRAIKKQLEDRSQARRNRRGRLRYRPARFLNRANAKTKGRLPPSVQSLVDDTDALIQTMRRLYPIHQIRAEYLSFDTQRMQHPDLRRAEYQKGTLQGWQIRHYILYRDDWTCQYCGQPGTKKNPLTLDHVIPKSQGGPSRVENLVTACLRCNTKKDNQTVAEFLSKDPERLARLQQQVDQLVPLTAAGHLNSVMPALLRTLEATGLPVTISDGVSTAYTRDQLDIAKSHVNDAACLDLPTRVDNLECPVTVLKRQARHRRQSINCDGKGRPAGKEFPTYSRLPREKQGYTTPPAHSVGPRRLCGIRTGDIVRIEHHTGQTYTGRATLHIKDQSVVLKSRRQGEPSVTAKATSTKLAAHADRWTVYTNQAPTKPAGRTSGN